MGKQQTHVPHQDSTPSLTGSPLSPHLMSITSSPISSNENSTSTSLPKIIPHHEKSHSNPTEMSRNHSHAFSDGTGFINGSPQVSNDGNNNNNIYNQLGAQNSKSINEINLAVVRESLDRRIVADSPDVLYATPHSNKFNNGVSNINSNNNNNNNQNSNNSCSSSSSENLLDIYNGNVQRSGGDMPPDLLYKNAPTISANGALVPPPYRDPPPPRNSPLQQLQQQHQFHTQQISGAPVNNYMQDYANPGDYDVDLQRLGGIGNGGSAGSIEESESIFQATQYNDLLQLIKFQREKISAQQLELTKVSIFSIIMLYSE